MGFGKVGYLKFSTCEGTLSHISNLKTAGKNEDGGDNKQEDQKPSQTEMMETTKTTKTTHPFSPPTRSSIYSISLVRKWQCVCLFQVILDRCLA
jgi:hypothetical protein